jgi:glycosyltransferase involved in cell wall biosynthesis
MRIVLSTSVIQRGRFGVSQYVFGLIKALLPWTKVHDFSLIVLEEDLPLFEFAAKQMTVVPISECYRAPVKNIVWHQVVLPRWLKQHAIDVLHVPTYRRMLYSAQSAMVTTIHDLGQFHVAKKYDPARMLYGRVIARHLANCQDQIIAVSQSTARDVEQFFHVAPDRIHVAYNGLDHGRFFAGDHAKAKAEARTRWEINRPFFLYVSLIAHPQKNHVRLIEAFNQFRTDTNLDWQLVFSGSDHHDADAVHVKAQQSPFFSDIRFLGFVEDAVLPTLYRAADVTVCPSLFEGFGFPTVEAMACGCPVVCSNRGALPEVVGSAAGMFDPENVGEMTAALQRSATDSRWRAQLRTAGFMNARRFNWCDHAEKVVRVYEQANSRRKASRRQRLELRPLRSRRATNQ